MPRYGKRNLPVSDIRRFLEPGPIVLVSSAWKGRMNIMTMGWHMVMMFEPSRIGCFITDANHSYEMIRRSKECRESVGPLLVPNGLERIDPRRAPRR